MKATKSICELALRYLDAQRLPPSPNNYRLAFAIHERRDDDLAEALAAITEGGIRVTQAAADALYEQSFGRVVTDRGGHLQGHSDDVIRHQTLRLADLATSATAITGSFSKELTDRLPDIANADAAGLTELFAATLERSQRAERELEATGAQVEQLRKKLEVVQGDAERDALTGLPNRRGIDVHLTSLRTSSEPVFIALCDIDLFKLFNDRYGHAVGDRVLQTVAGSLLDTLPDCFVGRWGGEEFIVTGKCDVQIATKILRNAKMALRNRQFKLRETDQPLGPITFSAGLTLLTSGEDPAAALARSDSLLYQAKHAGRDCVLAA